jgi:hypothetical protein
MAEKKAALPLKRLLKKQQIAIIGSGTAAFA